MPSFPPATRLAAAFALFSLVASCAEFTLAADTYNQEIQPLVQKYCVRCHGGGDEIHGEVNFVKLKTDDQITRAFETWATAIELIDEGVMPPEDELQLTAADKSKLKTWYQERFVDSVKAHPGYFRPRRLSVNEYRNTLRSLFGFDLELAIKEAEQTVTEKSLVKKLLPTDPPGPSGFTNDTSANPLTTYVWDQYSFLVDSALENLFSVAYRQQLEAYTGKIDGEFLTNEQAVLLIQEMTRKAYRRDVEVTSDHKSILAIQDLEGEALESATVVQLKTVLMSSPFIYRGLLMDVPKDSQQPVDSFELAERLSYFIWGDMPDDVLLKLASDNDLKNATTYSNQIKRLLDSPKAQNLANNMCVEWFSLNEVAKTSNNPPIQHALRSQPIDYLTYLFREGRPITELVDSDFAFMNPHTSRFYPNDRKKMKPYRKQRGIEVEAVPNQLISLENTPERGGLLTIPGVLAMNKGPVIRGTWVLERILGEHLPDPPANVGNVPNNKRGENLSFRERFEMHRSNKTCAVCHDKIDPLGFALQAYGNGGEFIRSAKSQLSKKELKQQAKSGSKPQQTAIDTSGQLPSGETFDDFQELKKILVTTQKERLIRNVVQRTMSFALCRKLEIYDRPTVDAITEKLHQNDGTFHDLIYEIANSLPFKYTEVKSQTSGSQPDAS